jgi:uncharacterized protein
VPAKRVSQTAQKKAVKSVPLKVFYDCSKCPAYCCTYSEIGVTRADVQRIAKRFGVTMETALKRYVKEVDGKLRLRHRPDPIFVTACRFLHKETRRCTIYEHRPKVCRTFPEERRCGYYTFLQWERTRQGDPECIP